MHDKVSQGTKWGKRDLNGVKETYRPQHWREAREAGCYEEEPDETPEERHERKEKELIEKEKELEKERKEFEDAKKIERVKEEEKIQREREEKEEEKEEEKIEEEKEPTPLLERSRCESLGVFLQASKTIVIERVLWSNARRMRTFTARTKFPLVNSRSGLFRLMVDPLFHVIGNQKTKRPSCHREQKTKPAPALFFVPCALPSVVSKDACLSKEAAAAGVG